MTITPLPASAVPHTLPYVRLDAASNARLQISAEQDSATTARSAQATTQDSSAYDSVWTAETEIPTKQPQGFEQTMIADGKILVVLAVVLIIWFAILGFLFRTDRRITSLEREIEQDR
ncbi:hypothetical protein CRI94_08625 [Longibacter salinarum]|uniref:CcmD family protein n=1 Tax=Longibacter salinarum TaxID=1850348 RepID=A0A2A8CXF0_9BACT|nr:CcmD family protein [Longibacter salinarum]PEN13382.1 hypothetical protein CRI94_08625 [Longibacter salinarum]